MAYPGHDADALLKVLITKGDDSHFAPGNGLQQNMGRRLSEDFVLPVNARPSKDRFKGSNVRLIAPDDSLCAEFVFSLLTHSVPSSPDLPLYGTDNDEAFLFDVVQGIPDTSELAELKLGLEAAVADMTQWQKLVLLLRLQGYKFTEIARYVGRTEGSPRSAYNRAVRHLRHHLLEDDSDRDA